MRLEQRANIMLPPTPEIADIAMSIQNGLFEAGQGRAAGVSDIQIAATAIHHSATDSPVIVIHYDADCDDIRSAMPMLKAQWIPPRGTIDEGAPHGICAAVH